MKLKGLNIQYPWSQKILDGVKTIETRNYPCPAKFLNQPLFLIETPGKIGFFKARIVAVIEITESNKYKTKSEYLKDTKAHHVQEDSEFFWTDLKTAKYGWKVKVIKKLHPHEAPTKRGYVWTGEIELSKQKKLSRLSHAEAK